MMIEVNLLPAELRRVEHTPLPRFLVIIIGTAVVMATTAFGVVINLRKVPDLSAKQAALVKDITGNQSAGAVYDKLQDEISDAKARKQAIAEVWRTRIIWSRKLAQLAQMTPAFVGFTEIKLDEARGSGGGKEQENGGMLTLESIIAGSDLDRVANWRRIVEGQIRLTNLSGDDVGKNFYRSFLDLLPTETTKVDAKDDYVEREALKVALKIPVKKPATRLSEALEAAQQELNPKGAGTSPTGDRPARRVKPEPTSGVKPSEKSEVPAKPADDAKKEQTSATTPEVLQDGKTQVATVSKDMN